MSDSQTIHEAVRQRYGEYASGQLLPMAASCCGGEAQGASSCCSSDLYTPELLADLPAEVTGLSLGCGDPVTIAALRPGETVLDLGSGGGIDCFLAARQVGPTGHVIGVDMTPEMLQKANASRDRLSATNVEFRQGQIEALPVESDSVDVIISNCVINLSPDKRAVFAEAFRVLKPGGRLAVSDIVTLGEFSAELRAELTQWAECVTGAIDIAEYTGMLREAGFEQIDVVDKADPHGIITVQPGMPRVLSARITARKPR